jgi:methylated-DNA-[protein]-cysteine S-methyltransferase
MTTMKRTTLERALIAFVLGEETASPALATWLATTDGRRALATHRRVLRGLDAWGAAVALTPHRRRGPQTLAPPATANAVYCGALATPLGPVLAAVSDRGLVGLSFGRGIRAFGAELARRGHAPVVRADARLARMHTELREYLTGTRRRFQLAVDLRSASEFQRRVLMAARRIPRGRVSSYGEIARRIGQPGASRAVGQALGHNPVPIVIPCHRVVAAGGRLGGYVGGTAIKRKLLALEGAAPATGRWS